MKETTESPSSLLIFRTALLLLLSQGAEQCSLDTRITSGCDLCSKNPSSHNRPFPQHITQRSIHTHSCLHLNNFHWGGGSIWGIRAQRLILTSLKSIVWVQLKTGNILLFPDERIRVRFHCVMSSREVLFFGEGERFSSTKQTHLFQFSRLTVHFLPVAVEKVKLVWLSSYSDI